MTESPNSSTVADVLPPDRSARWKANLVRLFKLLGVSSVMSAVAFWNTVCKPLQLCPISFSEKVSAALGKNPGGAEAIRALLPEVRRKHDNAAIAFTLLSGHLKAKLQRNAEISCVAAKSSAFPADLQAVVTVLVAAADRADSTLRLDSLNLSGVSLRRERLLRPYLRGSCLIASAVDSAIIYGGHFDGADLRRASLRATVLDSSNLQESLLDSAVFAEALLTAVDMSNVRAIGTTFFSASMPCALLGNAELAGANFSLARLSWAYLGGAEAATIENLLRASSVTHAVLDGVHGLSASVAQQLRSRGAVLSDVSDLAFSSARLAQFAPDSTCHLIAAASVRDSAVR